MQINNYEKFEHDKYQNLFSNYFLLIFMNIETSSIYQFHDLKS